MTKAEVENINNRALWRGKEVENNNWIEGFLVSTNPCTIRPIESKEPNLISTYSKKTFRVPTKEDYINGYVFNGYEIDPATLCQCTGITEMISCCENDNLIFENDIVKCRYAVTDINEVEIICKIVVVDGAFRILHASDKLYYFGESFDTIEIIGNKIDNPEILEGNDE